MCKSDTIIIKLEIVNSLLNTSEMHRLQHWYMYVYGSQIKILQDMNQILKNYAWKKTSTTLFADWIKNWSFLDEASI